MGASLSSMTGLVVQSCRAAELQPKRRSQTLQELSCSRPNVKTSSSVQERIPGIEKLRTLNFTVHRTSRTVRNCSEETGLFQTISRIKRISFTSFQLSHKTLPFFLKSCSVHDGILVLFSP
ncbi:uncharacterized protein V6R79_003316 [Siganus canaliculatus]